MGIGERLRAARERVGVTQSELARAVGQSRTTIHNWERGVTRPRRLEHVQRYLGVDENFDPLPDAAEPTDGLGKLSNAELVSHLHMVAAEMARRLGETGVTLRPGTEADLRDTPGTFTIPLPAGTANRKHQPGERRHTR